jgi:hypothetical protein
MLSRRASLVFGIADVATALVLGLGVFVGLPSRWLPVDAAAMALVVLDLASGIGLLASRSWATRVARWTSVVALALGLWLITVLAVTAGWLSGVYGPVGLGGAVILALVAALALPYLVVLPIVRLVWLREASRGPA